MSDLLSQVRQYLNITWEDEKYDAELNRYIESSKKFLTEVAGNEDLDFDNPGLPNDLLMNRVLYMDSKNMNDVKTNYSSDLYDLMVLYGKKQQEEG